MGGGRKKVRNVRPKREEVDRISSLPDDLIHRIVSDMDAKEVIQTCLLSTRWRHVWRSLPYLNFNGRLFSSMPKFTKFVSKFLSNRSSNSDISVFNFTSCLKIIQHSLIRKIALHTHNAQKLKITSRVSSKGNRQLPLSVFSSGSLKELCLYTRSLTVTNIEGYSWGLKALTTLVFYEVSIVSCHKDGSGKSIDHFSNLLNLKSLTLTYCRILNSNSLNITSHPLETLTISCQSYEFVVSAPNLSSFNYHGDVDSYSPLSISSDNFPCLERVNLNVSGYGYQSKKKDIVIKEIIGLFHKLCNATSLTLTLNTVCLLSYVPELLENQTSPFRKLNCLKIVDSYYRLESTTPSHAITYLCNSSPNSTIINECEEYFLDP